MPLSTFARAAAALSLSLGALASAGAASAASLDGTWRTAQGDGLVQFRDCGGALCGYLVARADAMGGGELLLDRLKASTGAAWTDGRILDPSSKRVYAGEVRRLDPERIKVTGCLVRPLCGSQVWSRAR